jgi:cell division initiation protein
MSYTPVELRHVRVARGLFGYKRAAVEQLLLDVADSFEGVWRERGELADEVEELEKTMAELKHREELLTRTLVAAEQAASDVRDAAKRQAELIIAEAHQEARSIARGAQNEHARAAPDGGAAPCRARNGRGSRLRGLPGRGRRRRRRTARRGAVARAPGRERDVAASRRHEGVRPARAARSRAAERAGGPGAVTCPT